jgi:hypothetical protein
MRIAVLTTSLLLLLILSLSACGGDAETPPSGENALTEPTATGAEEDGATPAPSATAVPATSEPTATSAPLVIVEDETTLAPTPTGVRPEESDPASAAPCTEGLIAAPFADKVNPLTGENVGDPAMLDRRPVAVKISNYPPVVRPQSGLNSADLIFEHYAEGGVTRFTAVFYDTNVDKIGSIRSGRLIDLEIPKMYDAAFAYSGSSGPVRLMMRDSSFFDRIISPDFGHGGFYRAEDPNKAFEHTLFTDTPRLRAILEERGLNNRPQFTSNMAFSSEPPAGGTAASSIELNYIGTNAFWQYNAASGDYLRWTDGDMHTDANSGEQVRVKNVIVLAAHHQDTDILEDNVGGGHYSIQIQLWGEGPVSIFRDGQRFDGRWRRDAESDMLTFYDEEGNILPLNIGRSFFQLVPLGFTGLTVSE